MAHTERLGQLRENLTEYFDLDELRSLCFDLGVDWDRLRGEEKAGKVTALLTSLDNIGRVPELIERCARLRPNIAWQEILQAAEAPSPFKGLQYFDEADADLFFGRELLTARLVARLSPQPPLLTPQFASGEGAKGERFLGVVGASGSGKSSVVRAGLVPALRHGEPLADGTLPPEGSTRWPVHIITPTHHPLESLATNLTRDSESVTATATLMDDLVRDPRSLHLYVRKLLARDGADHLLLVVDQFEELFTACKDEALRRTFVDNLLYAVGAPSSVAEAKGEGWREAGGGPTLVVIALRADFYTHCAQYADLREALAQHQEFIGPMTADELRRAIEEPAHRNGWEFEVGLVDLLLRDAGDEPGALPLLSHALLETWKRRSGRTLTLAGYADCGGVRGAIAKTADDVYGRLTPDQQQIARNIFMRLTELGEGTQDTRRRVALTELVPRDEDKPAIEVVVKLLADARLVTTAEEIAEVAHEALIREWPMLRNWLDENREGLRTHRCLTEAAQEWQQLDRNQDVLYRGVRLAQAFGLAQEHADELNTLEREFLQASQALAQREEAEREAARQRELKLAQEKAEVEERRAKEQAQAANRLRTRNRITTAAGAVAMVAAIIAIWFGIQANHQRQVALARQLAAQAQQMLVRQPSLLPRAVLLAAESLRRFPTTEANQALGDSLALMPRQLARLTHDGEVNAVAFSPDGQRVASASSDGTARVWEAATGRELARLTHDGEVIAVAFSPDGQRVATASDDQTVRVWEVSTSRELARLTHDYRVLAVAFSLDGKWVATVSWYTAHVWEAATGRELVRLSHDDMVHAVAFSPDGKWVATASDDNTARVWEATTGRELARLTHDGRVWDVAFSPDGKRVATASDDNTARVWEAATGRELARLTHDGRVWDVAFSPAERGQRVASASLDKTARVWEASTGREFARLTHDSWVSAVAFSPDGKWVATASFDNTARVWEAATGREFARLTHDSEVEAVAFSPDGQRVATTSSETVCVWEAITSREVARLTHNSSVFDVAFSPDGKWVATASEDQTARVWEAATGREVARLTHDNVVKDVTFSPDGKWVATASLDNTARVWEATTGRELARLTHSHAVYAVAFSPDGKWVATASEDRTARVWEATTGRELARLEHFGMVYAVAFSPDGKWVATASKDGTARLWEATTGRELARLTHDGQVLAVAFSPDGKWVATASFDNTARVWEAATGRELARLKHVSVNAVAFSPDGKWVATASGTTRVWEAATGRELTRLTYDSEVEAVAFSPDGQRVATASFDNTARVWEAATGRELARLTHDGWVSAVAFSPDGQQVATASYDRTARVWLWHNQNLIDMACSRLTRNLTKQEWKQYLPDEVYRKTCPNLPEGK